MIFDTWKNNSFLSGLEIGIKGPNKRDLEQLSCTEKTPWFSSRNLRRHNFPGRRRYFRQLREAEDKFSFTYGILNPHREKATIDSYLNTAFYFNTSERIQIEIGGVMLSKGATTDAMIRPRIRFQLDKTTAFQVGGLLGTANKLETSLYKQFFSTGVGYRCVLSPSYSSRKGGAVELAHYIGVDQGIGKGLNIGMNYALGGKEGEVACTIKYLPSESTRLTFITRLSNYTVGGTLAYSIYNPNSALSKIYASIASNNLNLGAKTEIPFKTQSRFILGTAMGTDGFYLSLGLGLGYVKFEIPIIITPTEPNSIPSLSYSIIGCICVLGHFVISKWFTRRKKKVKKERGSPYTRRMSSLSNSLLKSSLSVERRNHMIAFRRKKLSEIEKIAPVAALKRSSEKLEIVGALIGKRVHLEQIKSSNSMLSILQFLDPLDPTSQLYDCTIPLQALVQDDLLILGSTNKMGKTGFMNPLIDKNRTAFLYIRYRFNDKETREVIIEDTESIILPQP